MNPEYRLELQPAPYRARDGRAIDAAERGTLTVPMVRARPDGPAQRLAFVRLPARGERPGTPVVFLTGGPGQSAIRAGSGRLFDWFDALRAAGDVILLDQRGCGESAPRPECAEAASFPADRVLTRADFLRETTAALRRCAGRLAREGVDLSAFNTNESADDVADLVRALYGDARAGGAEPGAPRRRRDGGGSATGPAQVRQVALLGWSYGTHLAMAVIKRHEPLVARAVLAGPEGPDHTYKLPSRIQRHLEDVAARVRDDPAWRDRMPDLVATLGGVLARLEREPARAGELVVGRFDLEWIVAEGLSDPRFLRRLPLWLARMARGDFTDVASDAMLRASYDGLHAGPGGSALRYCVDCASGATRARRERIDREAGATLLGRTIDLPFPEVCDALGNPDLGDAFRAAPRAAVPVLFVTGTLDCRTPAENVADLAGGFAERGHLVVEDTGHGDLLLPAEAQRAIAAFLAGGPAADGHARADAPFAFERGVPALVYDDGCAFCRARVEGMRRRTGDAVAYVPASEAAQRFPQLDADELARAVHFVDTDGAVSRGAEAVFRALAAPRGRHPFIWMYRHVPGVAAIAEWGYRWVARHR